MISFRILSLLLAALSLGTGALLGVAAVRRPQLAQVLPRHRAAGVLLGLLVLCWCAHDGAALLPARYTALCWGLVPVCAVLCYFCLDFLLARSLGGLLVLLSNYLIQHAFAADCGCRPLFALVCLFFGIVGLVLLAWPWKMRDWLGERSPVRGRRALWLFGLLALPLIILPFL